jgi:hypothetical protein
MMTGQGPMGPLEMGGMFSVVKVRADQPRGDYRDPGWYAHPPGTVAYEYTGKPPEPSRAQGPAASAPVEMKARKPSGHAGHH